MDRRTKLHVMVYGVDPCQGFGYAEYAARLLPFNPFRMKIQRAVVLARETSRDQNQIIFLSDQIFLMNASLIFSKSPQWWYIWILC